MHGGKSEGLTQESMCHHHLIPHQFEWEKSLEDEIEKERKRKERGRREKERKGRRKGKRKKLAGSPSTDDGLMDEIHWTEKQSSSMRRQLRVGAKGGLQEVGFLLLWFISRLEAV